MFKNKMANKLKIKKNLLLGWKLSLVRIIPGILVGGIISLFELSAENPQLKELTVMIGALLLILYIDGLLVNKYKKWIFK